MPDNERGPAPAQESRPAPNPPQQSISDHPHDSSAGLPAKPPLSSAKAFLAKTKRHALRATDDSRLLLRTRCPACRRHWRIEVTHASRGSRRVLVRVRCPRCGGNWRIEVAP